MPNRFVDEVQAVAAVDGSATFTGFQGLRPQHCRIGTLTVGTAPPSALFTPSLSNIGTGQWQASQPSTQTKVLYGDQLQVTAIGLGAGVAYLMQFAGDDYDLTTEPAPPVYPGQSSLTGPILLRSQADGNAYQATTDFARRLLVQPSAPAVPASWDYPVGRVLTWEDFEGVPAGALAPTRGWSNVAGTTSIVTTNSRTGTQSLALTAAAGVGNQAIAQKKFHLLADQSPANKFPQVVVGCWFNPAGDVHWEEFHIRLLIDDSVLLAEAWCQFQRRAPASVNVLAYLNSAGGGTGQPTVYAISDNDVWHFLVMALNYSQGAYCTYQQLRIDDDNFDPTPPPSAYLLGASAGVRETTVQLVVTNAAAAATCTVLVDDFVLTDLSNNTNQP